MGTVRIPYLNPIQLVQYGHPYNKRFFQSMADFEDAASYAQPWNKDDRIYFQFVTDTYSFSLNCTLIDTEGADVISPVLSFGYYLGSLYYYQYYFNLDGLSDGYYYIKLEITGGINAVFYSEPIHVLESHDDTTLIKYAHDLNEFGIRFVDSSGDPVVIFQKRIHGGFLTEHFTPSSKDTVYTNENYDVTMVKSIPYVTRKLTVGSPRGVPNWVIDKVNRIFSCADVEINNRFWCKVDGAKWESSRIPLFPMASHSIELVSKTNDMYDEDYEITTGGDFNTDFNNDFNIEEV